MALDIDGPLLRDLILLAGYMRVDDAPHWSDDTSMSLQERWATTLDVHWMIGWARFCGADTSLWRPFLHLCRQPIQERCDAMREQMPIAPIPPALETA